MKSCDDISGTHAMEANMEEPHQHAVFDEDIIWMTTSFYEFFLAHGKDGGEALRLFLHYQYTARRQGTNRVWANDAYVRKGLKWGSDKLIHAKKFLIEHKLIAVIQGKDKENKFTKVYIQIKTKSTPATLLSGDREGESKCLKGKVKCLKEELREPEKQGSLKAELKLSQQERMPKPKKGLSADTLALVLHWNECCQLPGLVIRPSVHRITPASKTMKTVDTYIQQLQAGTFVRHCTELTPEWCATQKINHAWQNRRWSLEELKAAVSSYFLMFRGDHWPDTKAGKEALPTGLPGFMYSPRARQRKSYLLHVAVMPPKAVAKVEDQEVMDALVKCYTKVAHKPDQAERRTIEEAANGLVYWHRRLHRGVVPLCSLEFDKTYRTAFGLALKLSEFISYLYNNDRADMECYPGMFKPGSKTWTAFLHFCEDQFHVPINVDGDDEDWAWKYVENTVRGFARRVEEKGMERARVLCGDRIPYLTIEQCDQRKAQWMAEHGNPQWGRGIIREVLKGKK